MVGLIVLAVMIAVALLAPVLANSRGLDPIYATATPNAGPSLHDLLGTDNDGRSVLTLLIWGARNSLLVGFTATLISMLIGALVGVVAGHFGSIRARAGRLTDNLMMRATDWFLVVPFLPLAMVLATHHRPVARRDHPGHRPDLVGRARRGSSGPRRWPSRPGPTWSEPRHSGPATGTRCTGTSCRT